MALSRPRRANRSVLLMIRKIIGQASKAIISLDRPYKRQLLLMVDVVGVVIAYVFTLAVQDQAEILPMMRDSGLVIVPLLMAITAGTAALLKLPNIRLKSYDIGGMGRVALMAFVVALSNAMLHVVADTGLSVGTFVVFAIVFFLFSATSRVIMLDVLLRMYRAQGTRRPRPDLWRRDDRDAAGPRPCHPRNDRACGLRR